MTRRAQQAAATAEGGAAAPPRFRLVRPHGFVDEHGQHRFWAQAEIVGDPAQVALLTERGAALVPVDEE